MAKSMRPAPFFIADDPALDFLNSVTVLSGQKIEWVENGRDLLDWIEQANLVQANNLKPFQNKKFISQCDGVASKAREWREWFRDFVATHAGQEIDVAALTKLEPINTLIAGDNSYPQIEARDSSELNSDSYKPLLKWKQNRHFRSPEDLLFPIVEAMGNLVCNEDFRQVKFCEGPTCSMWFLDISKNHSRRWCTMSICGNRAKAKLHRARKKAANAK
jgi:predicted RNA-binding Zn ribbon-like protein